MKRLSFETSFIRLYNHMHFIFIDIQLLEPLFARFSTHYSWYISFISKISTKANRIAFFAYTFIDI